tara:strand:+ start:1384 stop:1629 length:246 start_codon:yes stop_codon:yes gene_type:complete
MGLISYIKKRKRNAVTFILILIPIKTFIHFQFFEEERLISYLEYYEIRYILSIDNRGIDWIISIIILSLIVFTISDKIKAR